MANVSQTRKTLRRNRLQAILGSLALGSMLPVVVGCHVWDHIGPGPHDTKESYFRDVGLSIEYPEVADCETPVTMAAEAAIEPNALADPSKMETIDLSLDQAVAMAMQNSPVIRSLNASVTLPNQTTTVYDPGLFASSQQGTEAALSAFDAQYNQSLRFFRTDRPNSFQPPFPGFPSVTDNSEAAFQAELQKRTATGSTFSLRHIVNYNRFNVNQDVQLFESNFNGWVEAEWRQPILRGAGLQYNRIVGNSNIPGQYNGVLIARIGEDIALADFENSIVGLVSDVEQAYWQLVTAYRLLEANVKARESALRTYQYQKVRLEVGAGRQDEEAQAQSQYYQFEATVQSQLAGPDGLYAREQRLRYLLGMPPTDGKLIRPTTDPIDAKVLFDWNASLSQALARRVEIRRQRFQVKQRELELYAARLNKRPQLDLVGLYRFQGLGDNLIGDAGNGPQDGLYTSIKDASFQEWSAGIEFSLPVGLRQASTAIANAKLNLRRERAVLAETELRIVHDLSDAARNLELTYQLVDTNYNRYQSDLRQVDVLRRRYLDGTDNINFLLQAQRQVVQSESAFYEALAAYNLAIRDLHRQKGSLLAYNQVQLAEGQWEPGATRDAYQKGLFLKPRQDPSATQITPPVTRMPFNPSEVQAAGGMVTGPQQDMIPMGQESEGGMINDEMVAEPTPAPTPDAEDSATE
jgi:outer membrane protein TolC